MTDTRDKLLEAKYFLAQMRQNVENSDAFRWNLSAFLNAFRSITFVMQKEFNKTTGFTAWYAKKRDVMKADREMKFLDDTRDEATHQRPVRPKERSPASVTTGQLQTHVSPAIPVYTTRADGTIERILVRPGELSTGMEKSSSASSPFGHLTTAGESTHPFTIYSVPRNYNLFQNPWDCELPIANCGLPDE